MCDLICDVIKYYASIEMTYIVSSEGVKLLTHSSQALLCNTLSALS